MCALCPGAVQRGVVSSFPAGRSLDSVENSSKLARVCDALQVLGEGAGEEVGGLAPTGALIGSVPNDQNESLFWGVFFSLKTRSFQSS